MLNRRRLYVAGSLFFTVTLLLVALTTLAWADVNASPHSALHTTQSIQFQSAETIRVQQPITYQINDIVGAVYDPVTKDLVVIGQVLDEDLPMMDYDYIQAHLLASLRAVHETTHPPQLGDPQGPAVTIDPISNDPTADHEVKFFGNITNTHYGYAFFEADRLLKTYTLGKDNLNPDEPFTSTVSGYSSYFDRLVSLGGPGHTSEASVRWWFTPSLNLRIAPITSQTIVFSNTRVILNRELTGSSSIEIQAADEFVKHFNNNYSLFASEQRVRSNNTLYELPQLYKLYGISYWSWAESNAALNLAGVNQGWLNHYPIVNFTTPVTTPVISRTDNNLGLTIYGGVGTNPPNSITDDPDADQLGILLLADRPSPELMAWTSEYSGPCHNPTVRSRSCTTIFIAMAFRFSNDLLVNGSFEGSPPGTSWNQIPNGNFSIVNGQSHWGNQAVLLGTSSTDNNYISQQITIPNNAIYPRLSYYWVMFSNEPGLVTSSPNVSKKLPPSYLLSGVREVKPIVPFSIQPPLDTARATAQSIPDATNNVARDFLYVEILDTANNLLETLQTISNDDIRQYWQVDSFSLEAYTGQTIYIRFRSTNDNNGLNTQFLIDDISLDMVPPTPTDTSTPTPTNTHTPPLTSTSTPTATSIIVDTPTPPPLTNTPTPTITPTVTPTESGEFRGVIYLDLNANSEQDEDEPGIGNVKITIRRVGGEKKFEFTTKNDGKFIFENLPFGDYVVTAELPECTITPFGVDISNSDLEVTIGIKKLFLPVILGAVID